MFGSLYRCVQVAGCSQKQRLSLRWIKALKCQMKYFLSPAISDVLMCLDHSGAPYYTGFISSIKHELPVTREILVSIAPPLVYKANIVSAHALLIGAKGLWQVTPISFRIDTHWVCRRLGGEARVQAQHYRTNLDLMFSHVYHSRCQNVGTFSSAASASDI